MNSALFDDYGLVVNYYFNDMATMRDNQKILNATWRLEDETIEMLDNDEDDRIVRIGALIVAHIELKDESIIRFERDDGQFISEIGVAILDYSMDFEADEEY